MLKSLDRCGSPGTLQVLIERSGVGQNEKEIDMRFCRSLVIGLLLSIQAVGQEPNVPAQTERVQTERVQTERVQTERVQTERVQTEQDRTTKSVQTPADPFAELRDRPAENADTPTRRAPQFPVGGFTGDNTFALPPLKMERQPGEVANQAAHRRAGNNLNRSAPFPRTNQPPIYLPNYNPNRPYGYPGYVYPGYGYPGYRYPGYVYPGYGYGYGYGVLRPGISGGVPGGSNFFGNPHASQYFGNPHASQGK